MIALVSILAGAALGALILSLAAVRRCRQRPPRTLIWDWQARRWMPVARRRRFLP